MITLNESNPNLNGFTAIIPSIGVGNVSQLAVDLVIATLNLKRLGNGYHNACMPIFGPSAYEHDNKNKTTSLEIYWDKTKKLIIFQLRSPLVGAYLESFHTEIIGFLKTNKIHKVIILTSSHAYEKHSPNSPIFEYLQNDKYKILNDKCKQVSEEWKEFDGNIIFGGGNAKKLLNCCTLNGLPSLVLFKYVSEGDNSIDASQLVCELNKIIELFPIDSTVKLTIPSSWNFLFGNSIPELIF